MQIMADRIEFCWIHFRGIGTLENSLWGYDGKSIRVWLDALTIEAMRVNPDNNTYESVKESVTFTLDFYPLCMFRVPQPEESELNIGQLFSWTRESS